MKKSLLSFTLAMLMMFSFAGCSSKALVNENINDTDTSMESVFLGDFQ